MKEVEKLVSIATEVCNWLYNQKGMIAADLAKDLAKQISLASKELESVAETQKNP